jgi:hypothetical protein
MPILPSAWSEPTLRADAGRAVQEFKAERLGEPLEVYLEEFERFSAATDAFLEASVDLLRLRENATILLALPESMKIARFLAGPFISHDDLQVLAGDNETPASLAAGPVRRVPGLAERIADTILLALDRSRFPWVSASREPTPAERSVAVSATAALMATERTRTLRRNSGKEAQEADVARLLIERSGFEQVATRVILRHEDAPEPGTFCRETDFLGRKADIVARLWDGRIMPLECKVSNSSTNSVKRLNEASQKAEGWRREGGNSNVVPGAVLSGVFKVRNLVTAQATPMSIWWSHSLSSLVDFVNATRVQDA